MDLYDMGRDLATFVIRNWVKDEIRMSVELRLFFVNNLEFCTEPALSRSYTLFL